MPGKALSSGYRETLSKTGVSPAHKETLELRKEKNAGRQEEGERGRERREAGRGKGERRAEEGGTERQRVLGETAREPLHEKAERSSKKALRAGVLSSTLSSAAVRVGRRPDGRRAPAFASQPAWRPAEPSAQAPRAAARAGSSRGSRVGSRAGRRSCSALGPPHALAASAVGLGVRA